MKTQPSLKRTSGNPQILLRRQNFKLEHKNVELISVIGITFNELHELTSCLYFFFSFNEFILDVIN